MTDRTVLIMAAGTGGHIFPALSIARELQLRGVDVQWLGTETGMEAGVLRDTGITLHRLSVSGLRGKGVVRLLLAPFMILGAVFSAMKIIRQLKPCCVLGMGGYVSGPGGLAAWLSRTPLVIHEQNAIAGMSNRLLAPLARRVLQGLPGAFSAGNKVLHIGNPVRSELIELSSAPYSAPGEGGQMRPLNLLILGGSLGAQAINRVIPQVLADFDEDERPHVVHQSGAGKLEETQQCYAEQGISLDNKCQVSDFINDMAAAYKNADLVICRAGAGTISELAMVGRPSVLVPYPHAVDDHQTANAHALSDHGAAVLLPQTEFSRDKVYELLARFIAAPAQLSDMAAAAAKQAMPLAAKLAADVCLEQCGEECGDA